MYVYQAGYPIFNGEMPEHFMATLVISGDLGLRLHPLKNNGWNSVADWEDPPFLIGKPS